MLSEKCGNRLYTYIPNYVVFDLETTGTSCHSDAVVEISAVKVKDGSIVDEFSTLVDPQRPIPYIATTINGISDDMVKGSPIFKTALEHFLNFAGNEVLVGHNINSFDMKFIYRDVQAYWGKSIDNDYIDTYRLAQRVLKGLGSYSLGNLASYYGISTAGAHRALNDCRMNQQVFEQLGKEMGKSSQFCAGSASESGLISDVIPGIVPGTIRCPKCGSSLIKRNGKFGKFWGCLNYPDCKYTRDAN